MSTNRELKFLYMIIDVSSRTDIFAIGEVGPDRKPNGSVRVVSFAVPNGIRTEKQDRQPSGYVISPQHIIYFRMKNI